MEKNNYITPVGFQRLQTEFEQLTKVERPEVTKLVQWAASNGDRSENADYQYGKKRLREIDRRLRFLAKRLESAVVIDPVTIISDRAQFGATIKVEDEEGRKKVFSIVGVDEIATDKGRISWQSPIGRSLLGKEEGDEVIVRTPMGEVVYTITEISYIALE